MESLDIAGCFERYGWTVIQTGEHSWGTTFAGDNALFTINVELTADWLLFAIDFPLWPETEYRRLLVANSQMMLAKFAIGPHGNLSLRAEIPTEGFAYSHFADCLGALSHYADVYSGARQP